MSPSRRPFPIFKSLSRSSRQRRRPEQHVRFESGSGQHAGVQRLADNLQHQRGRTRRHPCLRYRNRLADAVHLRSVARKSAARYPEHQRCDCRRIGSDYFDAVNASGDSVSRVYGAEGSPSATTGTVDSLGLIAKFDGSLTNPRARLLAARRLRNRCHRRRPPQSIQTGIGAGTFFSSASSRRFMAPSSRCWVGFSSDNRYYVKLCPGQSPPPRSCYQSQKR